jgi:hypothetical protein
MEEHFTVWMDGSGLVCPCCAYIRKPGSLHLFGAHYVQAEYIYYSADLLAFSGNACMHDYEVEKLVPNLIDHHIRLVCDGTSMNFMPVKARRKFGRSVQVMSGPRVSKLRTVRRKIVYFCELQLQQK